MNLKISSTMKTNNLMGDNIEAIKIGNSTVTDAFINQLLSSFFRPLITKPTRITKSGITLIDNILKG